MPRPRTAEPFEITRDQVGARRIVGGQSRDRPDGKTGRGDPRRVGESQVALVAQRLRRLDFKLSGGRILVEVQGRLVEIGALGGLLRFDFILRLPRECVRPTRF